MNISARLAMAVLAFALLAGCEYLPEPDEPMLQGVAWDKEASDWMNKNAPKPLVKNGKHLRVELLDVSEKNNARVLTRIFVDGQLRHYFLESGNFRLPGVSSQHVGMRGTIIDWSPEEGYKVKYDPVKIYMFELAQLIPHIGVSPGSLFYYKCAHSDPRKYREECRD